MKLTLTIENAKGLLAMRQFTIEGNERSDAFCSLLGYLRERHARYDEALFALSKAMREGHAQVETRNELVTLEVQS